MKVAIRDPHEMLPLLPSMFQIMLALAEGERHGYGIMQEVRRQTGGRSILGPGTLYGTLKRLVAEGLIEESQSRPDPAADDERRRYYRLTDFGLRVARAEAERLNGLVLVARTRALLRDPEPRS
jgi:DNA-binding PadR family transcriptional regulator